MKFLKFETNNAGQSAPMMEYRAVIETESGPFAYWSQRDDENLFSNDHAVTIDGERYLVGFLDHEGDDCDWSDCEIRPSEVAPNMLAALMFIMAAQHDDKFDWDQVNHSI